MTLHDVNRAQSTTQRMNSSRPRPAAIPPAIDAAPSTSSVMAETSNPAHKPKPPLPPPPPQQAGMPTVLLTVYVQTLKLRKKLAGPSNCKDYIETVWGRGYVLREPHADEAKIPA